MNKIKARTLLALMVLVMAACGGKDTNNLDSLASVSRDTALVFTSETNIMSQENVETVTAVHTRDTEGAELIYRIVGGVDAGFFDIDRRTGDLQFREAPDFEICRDSNENNMYFVVISASDGANTTQQTVAISVIDNRLTIEVPDGYIKTLKLNWPAIRGVTRYQLFLSSDVITRYQPSTLDITPIFTTENVTLPVRLMDRFSNHYLLVEGYNDHDREFRSDSVDTRPLLVLDSIGYLKASSTEAHDFFGLTVALSADGQTLAVGDPRGIQCRDRSRRRSG